MKFLKVTIIALITLFAFNSADAQIVVRTGPRHPRKVVVVKRHHRYHRQPAVVVRHRRY